MTDAAHLRLKIDVDSNKTCLHNLLYSLPFDKLRDRKFSSLPISPSTGLNNVVKAQSLRQAQGPEILRTPHSPSTGLNNAVKAQSLRQAQGPEILRTPTPHSALRTFRSALLLSSAPMLCAPCPALFALPVGHSGGGCIESVRLCF